MQTMYNNLNLKYPLRYYILICFRSTLFIEAELNNLFEPSVNNKLFVLGKFLVDINHFSIGEDLVDTKRSISSMKMLTYLRDLHKNPNEVKCEEILIVEDITNQ